MIPLIVLHGRAGCGKDTIAAEMVRRYGATTLAFADPFKRMAQTVFGFTDVQLWGPSELRASSIVVGHALTDQAWKHGWASGLDVRIWPWVLEVSGCGRTTSAGGRLYEGKEGALLDYSRQLWRTWWKSDIEPQLETGFITPRHVLQTLGTEFGRRAFGPDGWTRYALRRADELLLEGGVVDRATGIRYEGSRPAFVVITDGRFANEVLAVKRAGGLALHIEGGEGLAGAAGAHVSEQDGVPPAWFDDVLVNDKSKGLASIGLLVDGAMERCGVRR